MIIIIWSFNVFVAYMRNTWYVIFTCKCIDAEDVKNIIPFHIQKCNNMWNMKYILDFRE